MSILKDIVAKKIEEVELLKQQKPTASLEAMPNFTRQCLSFKEHLLNADKLGIIAEFKHKSPSKGIINADAKPQIVAAGYDAGGASAISVLTESHFFGGSDNDLTVAKGVSAIPILRKDFVVDPYQIVEAKALGADAILLIAEILEKKQLKALYDYAYSIGLEVLVEIHGEEDLDKLPEGVQIVGVNSRNLNTFSVNLDHTAAMLNRLPKTAVKVAESGISSVDDYLRLRKIGFNSFLIGEFFMKCPSPGIECAKFTKAIKEALNHQNGE